MKYGESTDKYCPECLHATDSHLTRFYHAGKTDEGYDIQRVVLVCRIWGCECKHEIKDIKQND